MMRINQMSLFYVIATHFTQKVLDMGFSSSPEQRLNIFSEKKLVILSDFNSDGCKALDRWWRSLQPSNLR